MKLIGQNVQILNSISNGAVDELRLIERAGRTCYCSPESETWDGCQDFIRGLIERGHTSVLEHSLLTLKLTTTRAVANELVRHRHCGYSQESTRYCNYTKERFREIAIVDDPYLGVKEHALFVNLCETAEETYFRMVEEYGRDAQEARSVLPLNTATKLVMSSNYREWREVFKLRTSRAADPMMRDLMFKALYLVKETIPVIFDDINGEL